MFFIKTIRIHELNKKSKKFTSELLFWPVVYRVALLDSANVRIPGRPNIRPGPYTFGPSMTVYGIQSRFDRVQVEVIRITTVSNQWFDRT